NNNARFSKPIAIANPKRIKYALDEIGRFIFLEAQLRILMKVSTPTNDLFKMLPSELLYGRFRDHH
ncbi:MAG: hypothetical protein AAF193_11100, partial [Bacteroidota bacterium]